MVTVSSSVINASCYSVVDFFQDVKQQEHIANLLRQIKALNSSFESMKGNISVIHLEVIL